MGWSAQWGNPNRSKEDQRFGAFRNNGSLLELRLSKIGSARAKKSIKKKKNEKS